jgi:hypothetical protein
MMFSISASRIVFRPCACALKGQSETAIKAIAATQTAGNLRACA